MRKMIKRIAAAGLALVLAMGMLTGCGANKSEQSKQKVFTYDGTDVYLDEAWVYAKVTQVGYESAYLSTFGDSMWSMEMSTDEDGNPVTFEEMVKQSVIAQIKQVKVLVNYAKENNITLTSDEKKSADEVAEQFCKETEGKAILEETGANEKLIAKIYEENAIAAKVQEELVKDMDKEVSEDEARHSKVYKVVYKTTVTDEETNETKDMSADEKAAVKAKAEAALKDIQDGKTTIEDLAKELGVEDTAEETYGAGESAIGEDFEKVMAEVKDGDVAGQVFETEDGYVIAKMVAYTDEEATEAGKEEILSQRESELYQEKYDELVKDLEEEWDYAEDVDAEVWGQVKFAKETEATTEDTATEETTTEADATEDTTTEADATEDTTAEADTTEAE